MELTHLNTGAIPALVKRSDLNRLLLSSGNTRTSIAHDEPSSDIDFTSHFLV